MKWHNLTKDINEMILKDIDLKDYCPKSFSSWRSALSLCFLFLIALVAFMVLGGEIPAVSLFLPVAIGAYSTINATEVDANSPENSVLWGKVKDNFDYLLSTQNIIIGYFNGATGHDHDGVSNNGPILGVEAIGTDAITTDELAPGAVHNDNLYFSFSEAAISGSATLANFSIGIVYKFFWPQLRATVNTNIECKVTTDAGQAVTAAAAALTIVALRNVSGTGSAYARMYFIAASRDEPVVWFTRNKITGAIRLSFYEPEALLPAHPFDESELLPDEEIIVIQLRDAPGLWSHIQKTADVNWVLYQVHLGLFLGNITLDADKKSPARLSKDEAPAIHAPNIKRAKIGFIKPEIID